MQSIAFRVVSIYWHWQGVAPFPWQLNAKGPTCIGSTCVAHTSPHSAAAVNVIASLACVRLTGWPVAWNWQHAVLSADAAFLFSSVSTVEYVCGQMQFFLDVICHFIAFYWRIFHIYGRLVRCNVSTDCSKDDAGMSKYRLSPYDAYYHNWLTLNFTASDSSSDERCFLKVLIGEPVCCVSQSSHCLLASVCVCDCVWCLSTHVPLDGLPCLLLTPAFHCQFVTSDVTEEWKMS